MFTMESNGPKLSTKQIELFEQSHKLCLPDSYRRFMLKWNGGWPTPNLFLVFQKQGTSVLNEFASLDDLEDLLDIYEDRLPKGFIPIGDDPGGNVICLATLSPENGSLFFWDHEEETDDPNLRTNVYHLSDSIDEFLEKLYAEEI
ncbi:SMI1/KNR4 family protein [Shouchella lehensis]|uniref:Knr4/Smi1-like domain-containing protein n=3 Tax=Shouchella lehensis TaxID=300825 RepID=A0A060LXZ9_9BACI|nr:SMI1/KNR4 family protein [Shouchella lehensis]AIC93163.1 hypothetical protein BleG1_0555 [Shouchella lehensis G1]MBG9783053.1 hypothetical protein [Shouchella lehensis]TES49592.1 SMI1/KNR4 family protein [Shouchella lehensis]